MASRPSLPHAARVLESILSMPIYEYQCSECQHRFSVMVRRAGDTVKQPCPECGCARAERLISPISIGKTEQSVWEASGQPGSTPGADYYRDPRNIGRSTEARFASMGMDVPTPIKEKIKAARQGELPDTIRKDMA